MKRRLSLIGITIGFLLIASFAVTITPVTPAPESTTALPEFEVVVPWGLDHPRGKIIQSMITNHSTLGTGVYNFTFTQVGGGPSDRNALVQRFMAGDYPNLIITTQDWYTEFAQFGGAFWHDFSVNISGWTGGRAGWRADVPTGWWSILDKVNGDGTGTGIYALPFFGQSVIPYVNTDHFKAAGLNHTHPEEDLETLDEWIAACEALAAAGYTPFAMVGKLQSDIAYMNYMFGSTDNYINSSSDPATVFSWDTANKYGTNGSLSVEGFAAYLKMKGEGWVMETVDTDGGGEANTLFGKGNTSMVLCGPWGTGIFEGEGLKNFTAVPMPKNSDGVRSTITGGGISWVVKAPLQNATMADDAIELAQWLLEDENQMKTVENWLNQAWRIPVRTSVTQDAWFTAFPNRSNFLTHVESQEYAYPWGKQHPIWITVHESVMMPGYRDALLEVEHGKGYTDAEYTAMAQEALDKMAITIQCYYLGGPCVEIPEPTGTTSISTSVSTSISTSVSVSVITQTPGFELVAVMVVLGSLAAIPLIRRKRK